MNVLNPALLKAFRLPGLCEYCRKPCKMRCGHHVFAKGAGQVDHPWNLVKVGMNPRDCNCHGSHHFSGKPSRHEFLCVVSEREGVSLEFIDQVIPAVIALPPKMASWERASGWLMDHFPEDVAVKAAEIVKPMFKVTGQLASDGG